MVRSLVRLASGLVGTGLLVLIIPAAAHACSCAGYPSPREQARAVLEDSDGAFIGVLKSVRVVSPDPQPGEVTGPEEAVFRYRVRRSFGVQLDDFIELNSNTDGSSCGLSSDRGQKVALGIYRQPDGWTSGLCSYMKPKALRAVAGERGSRGGGPRAACDD